MPGSGARMNASPTRNACTLRLRIRATSAGVEIPDSVMTRRLEGICGNNDKVVSSRVSKERRLRLLMPRSDVRSRRASSSSLASCTSTNTLMFNIRSEEHTSELQSQFHLVCRLLLEKKNNNQA